MLGLGVLTGFGPWPVIAFLVVVFCAMLEVIACWNRAYDLRRVVRRG